MRGNALDNAYLYNESKNSEIFDEKRDTSVLQVRRKSRMRFGLSERVALFITDERETLQGHRGRLLERVHIVCFPKDAVGGEKIAKNHMAPESCIESLPGTATIFPFEMRGNALDNEYLHNESKNSEIFDEKRDTSVLQVRREARMRFGPSERVALFIADERETVQGCRGRLLEGVHVIRFPKGCRWQRENCENQITSEFLTASLPRIAAIFPSEIRVNALYNSYPHNESKKS